MPYYPRLEDRSGAILASGIRRGVGSMTEGFDDLDEEEQRRLIAKFGLAGPFETVTRLRTQGREGLAGMLGLRSAAAAPGGLAGPAAPAGPGLQDAVKAGAQSLAKNTAKKAIGAL